jgi:hypothetical protein
MVDNKRDIVVAQCKLTPKELASFIEYAAMFLYKLDKFHVGCYIPAGF